MFIGINIKKIIIHINCINPNIILILLNIGNFIDIIIIILSIIKFIVIILNPVHINIVINLINLDFF